mgnify:CR=1 FL=1
MRAGFVALSFLLMLCACETKKGLALKKISALESQLLQLDDTAKNRPLAQEVLIEYDAFIQTYPDSEETPDLLFKSGEVLKGMGAYLKSAKAFHKVYSQFPNTKVAPIALFQQAHCFESLDQRATAKKSYETFIERYPNHAYIDQAKGMIKMLHLSDEELIDQFQN